MNREEKAIELFYNGYNCAQAVVLAFKDLLNVDEESLKSLSSSFGGGISRLREVCGCISGMGIVLGLIKGNYDVNNNDEKSKHYAKIQELSLKFKEEMKSYICADLLNISRKPSTPVAEKRSEKYYKDRPCAHYIGYMAKLIAQELNENE